jgi:anti-sigma B factor antagonist
VSIVDLAGKITLGAESNALGNLLRDLRSQGHVKILLNMRDVSYIDSSGMGEMVSGLTEASHKGGSLKLLGLTPRVKDLLRITKLQSIFDVHEDEAQAVRSFSQVGGSGSAGG